MKIAVETPAYIAENYAMVDQQVYRIEDGPHAGRYAHVVPMLYTFGVMVSVEECPITRWCYNDRKVAIEALERWDGHGDPPGLWLRQKPEDRYGPGVTLAEYDL